MKIFDLISMCWRNLFRRKVRTILTVTGVVIGTCAIIVMISLGLGLSKYFDDMILQMGDLTVIQVWNYQSGPDAVVVDDALVEQMAAIDGVEFVTPFVQLDYGAVNLDSGRYRWNGSIIGVYPGTFEKLGYELKEGSYPDWNNASDETAVLVFGEQASYSFINTKRKNNNMVSPYDVDVNGNPVPPYVDPLQDKITLTVVKNEDSTSSKKPTKMRVVTTGILLGDYAKSYETFQGVFMDIDLVKQLNAEYRKLNNIKTTDQGYTELRVKVNSIDVASSVEEQIKAMGLETYSMNEYRKQMQDQTRVIQLVLGGLGGISLLIATIGITNTMIMSIYERTREIGIMKVLGCTVGNIRLLFLAEAANIGLLGSSIGMVFSYGISFAINKLSANFISGMQTDVPVQISLIPLWLVVLALLFGTFIGIMAGYYPANRAVKISALEAIKHE